MKRDRFLEVGIWRLFFALLVPAGFVGWAVGRSTRNVSATKTVTVTAGTAIARPGAGSKPWSLPNGDLANTRMAHGSSISSKNVRPAL